MYSIAMRLTRHRSHDITTKRVIKSVVLWVLLRLVRCGTVACPAQGNLKPRMFSNSYPRPT